MPTSYTSGQQLAQLQGQELRCLGPRFGFESFGDSGQRICSKFPEIGSMADDRTARMTRGRPAAGTFALRDPEKYRLEFATAADLDGDGRREIVLHYISLTSPFRSIIDILRLRP